MAVMATPEQAETTVCYRHPRTETAVACSSCGRPICTECMVFAAVGIKCPECAGQPTGPRKTAARVRASAGTGTGAVVTKSLIAINVAVYLLLLTEGNNLGEYAVHGPSIADGEWWRLVTGAFLHGSLIHLLFNMLMLWWFGGPLEELLGRGRFLAVYGISILAGSAGALLVRPEDATVGASGAVFGILGAGLILERRGVNVFGGAALMVVLLNIALSFAIPNISIGGHLGGLAGGALVILALTRFGRGHAAYSRLNVISVAGLVAVAVASVAIAYARVRGYA
jgi:membrane associated rhomboid family serine protease